MFNNLGQRQILVKHVEKDEYIGILSGKIILDRFASDVSLMENQDPDSKLFHDIVVRSLPLYPLLQKAIPVKISSIRIWMNSRGVEAVPLIFRRKPVNLVTEKDLFAYLAQKLIAQS